MQAHLEDLIPLPEGPYLGEIQALHDTLAQKYNHTRNVLSQEQYEDPTHLQILLDDFNSQDEILQAMSENGVPDNWIEACSEQCSALVRALSTAVEAARGV